MLVVVQLHTFTLLYAKLAIVPKDMILYGNASPRRHSKFNLVVRAFVQSIINFVSQLRPGAERSNLTGSNPLEFGTPTYLSFILSTATC